MKTRQFLLLMGLSALYLFGWNACSDDDPQWGDVDGAAPTLTLTSAHIQTEAGRTFTIEGLVTDKDGIAAIRLLCSPLQLNKTIDIIKIYEKPLESYDLSYSFKTNADEIGDSFTVQVTVVDVGGREVTQDLLITMDGDFVAPVFNAAPSDEMTVLLKETTRLNVKFTVSDDKALETVTVAIPELDYLKEITSFTNGNRLDYSDPIVVPSEIATYNLTITATDKFDHSVTRTSVITVSEMPDFPKMWLSDVEKAEQLNSDVFGVPMLIDHTGEYEYEARYYNAAAGTKIFFLPQRSDFSPISFGIDPLDNSKLTDDPEVAQPIVLNEAGVYYLIRFNVQSGDYSISTYPVSEAIDPIPHVYGSISLDTWFDGGSWLQEFYFGYTTSGPGDITRFVQDPQNPHRFWLEDPLVLEAGEQMNFIIHNWHSDGWWNYCTWRVDNSSDPEKFDYYGDKVNPEWTGKKGMDNWAKPVVQVSGSYRFYFDAHLGRGKMIPAN